MTRGWKCGELRNPTQSQRDSSQEGGEGDGWGHHFIL